MSTESFTKLKYDVILVNHDRINCEWDYSSVQSYSKLEYLQDLTSLRWHFASENMLISGDQVASIIFTSSNTYLRYTK